MILVLILIRFTNFLQILPEKFYNWREVVSGCKHHFHYALPASDIKLVKHRLDVDWRLTMHELFSDMCYRTVHWILKDELNMEWFDQVYEGGIKSNATNDVKWQLKVGLHFCLFQIVKIPSLHRYTNFQIFNSILEDFRIVFLGYTSKEV